MFLSMNWISDFVDFTGLDKVELIHRFSLSTAEVENEIFFKGSDISGIVVAEIKSVENHPDSKKLHLLKVDAGDGQLTDVVCGAPNVRVGLKTAFAKVGAKIGEIEIAPRKLAGYTSNGMCCSEKEIGISAVRGGTIVGDHDVIFAGQDEVITFSHMAYSRKLFATGAVSAAKFLAGKPAGMYDMSRVIEGK